MKTAQSITVELDNGFLIFTTGKNRQEIYDLPVSKFEEFSRHLRSKNWFTESLENECNRLIHGK